MTRRLISMVIAALMVLALVPVSIFAKTESNLKDPIMSYYGDGIEVVGPKVGDYTYFPVYISPNSSLYSFDVMVEYNSAYLNPKEVMFNSSTDNDTYPQLYQTIKKTPGVSDNYGIANENACQYDGATNPNGDPIGELGKTYARVMGFATSNNYGGIQLGGKENGALFWVIFEWVAIPEESCVLPMPITNVSSANAQGVEYADVACDDGAASYMDVTVSQAPVLPPEEGTYELVTDIGDIEDGLYVIYGVNPDDDDAGAMNNTIANGRMGLTEVEVTDDDKIVNPPASIIWEIKKDGDKYTIYNAEINKYCEVTADSTKGFGLTDAATNGYTIEDAEAAGQSADTFFVRTKLSGSTRMISIYESDFRPYNLSDWHPLYLYKYVEEEPELPPEFDGTVTFTGEEKNAGTPAVGDALTWDLSVSAGSKMFSGAWLVDYNENYLEPDEVITKNFDGAVYNAASASPYSDTPSFMETTQTIEGNDQWRLSMYLGTAEGLGMTAGGVMGRFSFNWKEIPTVTSEGVMQDENGYYLPMTITVVEATYSNGSLTNGTDFEENNITVVNGKIYFTPVQPEVVGVTFTGEEKNAGTVAEGDTVTWDLSVSAGSKLFSGAWLIDYDENYLEPDEVITKNFDGAVYNAANASAASDTPSFMETTQTIEGNDQWRLSMYLGTADGYGVTVGGVLGRFVFNWKAVPTADSEGVMHDEGGYYLPMTITVVEASYSNGSLTNGTDFAEDEITVIHGKIYFTPVETATLTINYVYADGAPAAPTYTEELNVGAEYSVTSPVIEGYTASQAVVSGTIQGDVTVTVIYTANTYTITWVIDGVETTESYPYGATPAHADPTKPADAQYTYTFAGWDPQIVPVTGDATYTATFEATPVRYTITWVIDGVEETEEYYYNVTPTHADPTKPADAQYTYTFAGWDPEIVPVTGDATYTATWTTTPRTYRIWVYYLNAETEMALAAGEYFDLPYGTVQTFTPKEIEGWVCTNPEAGLNYTVTGDGEIEFLYVPEEVPYEPVAPTVTGERVETRPRATEDGKTDLRFVFKVTFNDSYVLEGEDAYGPTQEYYKITKLYVSKVQGSGSPKELVCKNLYTVGDNYCEFTVVIKGIPESYNDLVFTMTPYIDYELNGQTYTTSGDPLVTSVNTLGESD